MQESVEAVWACVMEARGYERQGCDVREGKKRRDGCKGVRPRSIGPSAGAVPAVVRVARERRPLLGLDVGVDVDERLGRGRPAGLDAHVGRPSSVAAKAVGTGRVAERATRAARGHRGCG